MSPATYSIRDLIRYRLGKLPPAEAQSLLELCAANPAAGKHLDKVRRGLTYLERHPPVDHPIDISDEELAVWLDDPSAPLGHRVEYFAKHNDAFLLTVIDLARSNLDWDLSSERELYPSKRLVQLGDAFFETPTTSTLAKTTVREEEGSHFDSTIGPTDEAVCSPVKFELPGLDPADENPISTEPTESLESSSGTMSVTPPVGGELADTFEGLAPGGGELPAESTSTKLNVESFSQPESPPTAFDLETFALVEPPAPATNEATPALHQELPDGRELRANAPTDVPGNGTTQISAWPHSEQGPMLLPVERDDLEPEQTVATLPSDDSSPSGCGQAHDIAIVVDDRIIVSKAGAHPDEKVPVDFSDSDPAHSGETLFANEAIRCVEPSLEFSSQSSIPPENDESSMDIAKSEITLANHDELRESTPVFRGKRRHNPKSARRKAFSQAIRPWLPLMASCLLVGVGWAWFTWTSQTPSIPDASDTALAISEKVPAANALDDRSPSAPESGVIDPSVHESRESILPDSQLAQTQPSNSNTNQATESTALENLKPTTVREESNNSPRTQSDLPLDSRSAIVLDDRFTPPLRWQTIKGVVAIANQVTQELSGVNVSRRSHPGDRWLTLPQSWAQAEIDSQYLATLDEDSCFTVNHVKDRDNLLEINVQNGRVALSRLLPATALRIRAGDAEWYVETLDADTSIGVDYSGLLPIIFQRQGASKINGVEVRGREQATWQQERTNFTTLSMALPWLNGPRGKVFLNDSALLSEPDLNGALDRMARSGNRDPVQAQFLLQSRLSALPEKAYSLMESTNPGQSEQVFEWMLAQLDTARRPIIVRQLAERTGDRRQVQNVLQSFRQLRNPQTIPATLVQDACRHLDSQELFFRVAAKQFLFRLSNQTNPVDYSPHDPQAVRERKARAWSNLLTTRGGQPRRIP